MSDRALSLLTALAASLFASACFMVGPDYRPPDSGAAPAWSSPLDGGLEARPDAIESWWKNLGDPQLDDLLLRAVADNKDTKAALAKLRAARAARGGADATLFPSVNSSAGYERRRVVGTSSSSSREFNSFSIGFDSSWEIDLFGGLRRGVEQAQSEFEAAGADLHAVLLGILAEVARNYVELRSLQARIAIAEANTRSQAETLDLVRWRYQAGLTGALDADQAEYNVAQTRARIPELETQRAAAANRISVLIGRSPGSVDAELAAPGPVPTPPANVAVGVPVDLVRRRPDVTAAERRLEAATAAIGVAKADLYPRLTLSGSFTVAATDVARLDNAASRAFAIGPALQWNVFDAGRVRSLVAQRSAQADAALADWESLVLAAVEEAENALVSYAREQQRRDQLDVARAASRRAEELASLQYHNGLTDFQTVLEAERALLVFEESFAISTASVVTDLIALYKALGGGWQTVRCEDEADRSGCRLESRDLKVR